MEPNPEHNRLLQLVALTGLLVIIDQFSKAVVRTALSAGSSIALIDDVLRIIFVRKFHRFLMVGAVFAGLDELGVADFVTYHRAGSIFVRIL